MQTLRINNSHRHSTFFSAGSTVVIQREDGDPWMHDIMIEGNSDDH